MRVISARSCRNCKLFETCKYKGWIDDYDADLCDDYTPVGDE